MNNLRRVIDIIDDNTFISYDDLKALLAKELGSSFANISAAFNFAFNTSIRNFQNSRKLAYALNKIADDPDIKLSDLAADLKYNDQPAFSKAFKNEFGYTPGWVKSNPFSVMIPSKYELLDLLKDADVNDDAPVSPLSVSQLESLVSKQVSKQLSVEKEAEMLADEYELSYKRSKEAVYLLNYFDKNLRESFSYLKEFDDEFGEYVPALDEKADKYIYTRCYIDFDLHIGDSRNLLQALERENIGIDDISPFEASMISGGYSLKDAKSINEEIGHYTTEDGNRIKDEDFFSSFFPWIFKPIFDEVSIQDYINSYINLFGNIYRDGNLVKNSCEALPSKYDDLLKTTLEGISWSHRLTDVDIDLANEIHIGTKRDLKECYLFVASIKNWYEDDYLSITSDSICYLYFEKFGIDWCRGKCHIIDFIGRNQIDIYSLTETTLESLDNLLSLFSEEDLSLFRENLNEVFNKDFNKLNFEEESSKIFSFFKRSGGRYYFESDDGKNSEEIIRIFIKLYLKKNHAEDVPDAAFDVEVPKDFSIDDYWDDRDVIIWE